MNANQDPLPQLFTDARAYVEAQEAEADRQYREKVAQLQRERAALRSTVLADIVQDEPRLESLSEYITLDDMGGKWKGMSLCLPECDRIVMSVCMDDGLERWSLHEYNIYRADEEDWWDFKLNYTPIKDFLEAIDAAHQSYTERKTKEAQQAEQEAAHASGAAGDVAHAAKLLDLAERHLSANDPFALNLFGAVEALWSAYDHLSQAVGNGEA